MGRKARGIKECQVLRYLWEETNTFLPLSRLGDECQSKCFWTKLTEDIIQKLYVHSVFLENSLYRKRGE